MGSVADISVWQKPLQYCKVISLQLIKINGKKILKKQQKISKVKENLQGCGEKIKILTLLKKNNIMYVS